MHKNEMQLAMVKQWRYTWWPFYLFKSYDGVTFHYFVPVKSLGNTMKQLCNLFIFHRAQSSILKTKLLVFCTYSAKVTHVNKQVPWVRVKQEIKYKDPNRIEYQRKQNEMEYKQGC